MIDVPNGSANNDSLNEQGVDASVVPNLDNIHSGERSAMFMNIQYKYVEAIVEELIPLVLSSREDLCIGKESEDDAVHRLVIEVLLDLMNQEREKSDATDNAVLRELEGNASHVANVAMQHLIRRMRLKQQSFGIRYNAAGVLSYNLTPKTA